MNKKLLALFILISGFNIYGTDYPYKELKDETIEKTAYKNMLRMINELNRQEGRKEVIIPNGNNDKIDSQIVESRFIPIAQYTDSGHAIEDLTTRKERYDADTRYATVENVYNNSRHGKFTDTITEDIFNNSPYVTRGNIKRFYFGNNNVVKDIVISNSEQFEKYKTENKKNIKRLIEGEYTRLKDKDGKGTENEKNYEMSVDDYEKNVSGKSRQEVLKFLEKELKKHNPKMETVIENNELFVKNGGKNWKVLWELEPITTNKYDGRNKRKVINTNLYVYEPFDSTKEHNNGKTLETNDGSLYLEDNIDYKSRYRITEDNRVAHEKKFKKLKEDLAKVENKTMTQNQFDEKWVTPFKEGGKYYKEIEEFRKGEKKAKETVKNGWENLSSISESFDTSMNHPEIFEKYKDKGINGMGSIISGNYVDKKKYAMLTKEDKELVDKYKKYRGKYIYGISSIFQRYGKNKGQIDKQKYDALSEEDKKLVNEYKKHKEEVKKAEDLLYGRSQKWKDMVISDRDLTVVKIGKVVEFRGNGRINGLIDLGEGYNTLSIDQKATGKFGTNIVLGPYAKIKGVSVLIAGSGAYKDKALPSLSGTYSLALDIDPNIKNNRGELIQHAFKDSDKKMVFAKPGSQFDADYDFGVEMMVSKLNQNETINMGRDLEYKIANFEKNWREKPQIIKRLKVSSDSIAHSIIDLKQKDSNGNSLIKVELKERIDGLTDEENKVYQSIKNAKTLGYLKNTLTTTNKRTLNGGVRTQEALKELRTLIEQIHGNNIYSRVNKISKEQMDLFTNLPFTNQQKLDNKKRFGTGGYLSSRVVKDKFKGTVNNGYGIYNFELKDNLRVGLLFGGGTSHYTEIKNTKLNEISTDSKIKGQNIYLGIYGDKQLYKNINIITGVGYQFSNYDVERRWENNYEKNNFKGNAKTNGLNLYTGALYTHKLPKDMDFGLKSILSYTLINQQKIDEDKKPNSLHIDETNFNYIDTELGVNIGKTLYAKQSSHKLQGGLSTVFGLVGYDNKDSSAKIQNSTSSFDIIGNKEKKVTIKLSLNYDVKREDGILYGIEGVYASNSDKDEITMGIKFGYLW